MCSKHLSTVGRFDESPSDVVMSSPNARGALFADVIEAQYSQMLEFLKQQLSVGDDRACWHELNARVSVLAAELGPLAAGLMVYGVLLNHATGLSDLGRRHLSQQASLRTLRSVLLLTWFGGIGLQAAALLPALEERVVRRRLMLAWKAARASAIHASPLLLAQRDAWD